MEHLSCYFCGRKIESHEDYIIFGAESGARFGDFFFHTECFEKSHDEATKELTIGEEGHVFLKWVGKTWSFGRRYHQKLTVEDVKIFLKMIPKDVAREIKETEK